MTRDIARVLALLDHGLALSATDIADALGASRAVGDHVGRALVAAGLAHPLLAVAQPRRPRRGGHVQRQRRPVVLGVLWVGGRWA